MIGMNKVGDWHLVYDGEPLSDHFIIKNVELPLLPNIDAATIELDGKPGSWFSHRKIETRDIIVHAAMLNDNRSRIDMMEKWILQSDILAKNTECKLELGGGYWVNAILIGQTPIKRENGYWSEVELNFRCYDPYIYGEEHTVYFNEYQNELYIYGKLPVWPEIHAPYCQSNVKVSTPDSPDIGTPGFRPYIETAWRYDFSQRPSFVFYTDKHLVLYGLDYVPLAPGSTFFRLNPGNVTLLLEKDSGFRFYLKYSETYL